MDYLKEYKKYCLNYIESKTILIPNAPTKSQRRYEFERGLEEFIKEMNEKFSIQRDILLNTAYINGYKEIELLDNDIKFFTKDLLRQFKSDKKQSSEFY